MNKHVDTTGLTPRYGGGSQINDLSLWVALRSQHGVLGLSRSSNFDICDRWCKRHTEDSKKGSCWWLVCPSQISTNPYAWNPRPNSQCIHLVLLIKSTGHGGVFCSSQRCVEITCAHVDCSSDWRIHKPHVNLDNCLFRIKANDSSTGYNFSSSTVWEFRIG